MSNNDEDRRMNLAIQTAAVERHLREVMEKRAEQLEKLAAAFVAEVGAREASQFQLVEECRMTPDGHVTTWRFERRTAE